MNALKLSAIALAVLLAGCQAPQSEQENRQAASPEPAIEKGQSTAVQPTQAGKTVDADEARKEEFADQLIESELPAEAVERTVVRSSRAAQVQKSTPFSTGAATKAKRASMAAPHIVAPPMMPRPKLVVDNEKYQQITENAVVSTAVNPFSTFSIDVDTGSYSNVRRMLKGGQLPRHDAVRVEEMINYFNFDYNGPKHATTPFNTHIDMMQSPWNQQTYLLKLGVKGYEVNHSEVPPANLVFLVDVSGSMNQPNKLPLLKKSLVLLSKSMSANDRISLVVYAGSTGVVLEPTPGDQSFKIESALNNLSAGGSTHGAAGIQLAYKMAQQAFIKEGVNRVILATDGDFNVGMVNQQQLENLIEEKRKAGIALTTLGFGTGNYNEPIMEQLANKGNGNYAYIDSLLEAQKVLVQQRNATLMTIAKDVKIQMEFNPQVVAEYRLIGYENRALKREDFNNDKVDAGEIGAGHTVTALYEIVLTDQSFRFNQPGRYERPMIKNESMANELGVFRIRYKQPQGDKSQLIESVLSRSELLAKANQPDVDTLFASAVAAFGQQLRGGKYLQSMHWSNIKTLAQQGMKNDKFGYRGEFVQLLALAESLATEAR